jgi:ribosomal protein S18 acetylase RimI-like enzyme
MTLGGVGDLDGLKQLWLEMLEHHRDLVSDEFPIREAESSWEHARDEYLQWLTADAAILLIARAPVSSDPLGYVICRLRAGGPSFDLGLVRGEVDSLVVHAHARGQGIGTGLLEALRVRLVDRGVSYWSIGVLAHNPRATELYERVGFRPWTQELLAPTTRGG